MTTQYRHSISLSFLIAMITGLMLLVSTAQAADASAVKKEAQTAQVHAHMAQKAASINMVHMHLHHVINCLVGPDGSDYDASAGTPCKGQGNGAIPDSTSDKALNHKLKKALEHARDGLNAANLDKAHQAASQSAEALNIHS